MHSLSITFALHIRAYSSTFATHVHVFSHRFNRILSLALAYISSFPFSHIIPISFLIFYFLFTNFLLELDLLVLSIFLDAVNYNATVSVVPICGVATSESEGRSSVRSISAFVPLISFAKIPAAKVLCTKRDLCSNKESSIVKQLCPLFCPKMRSLRTSHNGNFSASHEFCLASELFPVCALQKAYWNNNRFSCREWTSLLPRRLCRTIQYEM